MTVKVLVLTALIHKDNAVMFALADIVNNAEDICTSASISLRDIDCQSVIHEFVHSLSDS